MRSVRRTNTAPELALRRALFRLGLRYQINRRDLPGTPDIAFVGAREAIFVHGCFWHRHENCKLATTPKSNTDYWNRKFAENVARDARALASLKAIGWHAVVVWQCEIELDVNHVASGINKTVRRSNHGKI